MMRLLAVAGREARFIFGSRIMLVALILVPLSSLVLIAAMLSRGALEGLPVAVVDEAQSPVSRSVTALLAARPELRIVPAPPSAFAAEVAMRRGQLWAYAQIPAGFGEPAGAADNRQPVRIFYNAAYLSVGSVLAQTFETALTGAMRQEAMERARRAGLPIDRIALPQVQVSVLFNPQASFEWFLQALIQPAILHLVAACVGVFAMARELDGASLARWRAETGGGAVALAGKAIPYLAILAWWGAAWMIWLVGVKGWRMAGSLPATYAAQVALLAATLAISLALVATSRKDVIAYSVSALYAGSALAYSGGSLPIDGASLPARIWHYALPFTHYLEAQMDQFLGAPTVLAIRSVILLTFYALAALAIAGLTSDRDQMP